MDPMPPHAMPGQSHAILSQGPRARSSHGLVVNLFLVRTNGRQRAQLSTPAPDAGFSPFPLRLAPDDYFNWENTGSSGATAFPFQWSISATLKADCWVGLWKFGDSGDVVFSCFHSPTGVDRGPGQS